METNRFQRRGHQSYYPLSTLHTNSVSSSPNHTETILLQETSLSRKVAKNESLSHSILPHLPLKSSTIHPSINLPSNLRNPTARPLPNHSLPSLIQHQDTQPQRGWQEEMFRRDP